MGRSPYQSEKRRKELARLKKQEEKRQRRFNKKHEGETSEAPADGTVPAGAVGPDGQPVDHVDEAQSETPPSAEQGPVTQGQDQGNSEPS